MICRDDLRSASVQADQSVRCPYEDDWDPWLPIKRVLFEESDQATNAGRTCNLVDNDVPGTWCLPSLKFDIAIVTNKDINQNQ